jgi:hypothetical protein
MSNDGIAVSLFATIALLLLAVARSRTTFVLDLRVVSEVIDALCCRLSPITAVSTTVGTGTKLFARP